MSYRRLVGFLALSGVISCGEERAPRSYVQPNVVLKDDLAGEYWFRSTITEVPPNVRGIGFVGAQTSVDRVWFDIQENHLYARRTYDLIEGAYDPEVTPPSPYEGEPGFPGAPIAAWSISHFDIIRDYNPSTGEESNRIIESTERPWYERQYVRVDWSMNMATNAFDVTAFGAEDVTVSAVSYWESDPNKDDGLHFERRTRMGANHEPVDADGDGEGDTELGYFDVTNHYVFDPVYGDPFNVGITYPMCFWRWVVEGGDCASQDVSVRHAFWKIPGDHEYSPREWTQRDMSNFGYFYNDRRAFNRQYWITQSSVKYFANRFNLFDRWFGPADPKLGERALLPLAERMESLRQIPYYLSHDQADSLWDASARTIGTPDSNGDVDEGGWDFAVRRVVAGMLELSEDEGDPVNESQIEERARGVPQILHLCHNPVRAGDDDICKTALGIEDKCTEEAVAACDQIREDTGSNREAYWSPDCTCKVRNGDVRYSILWWVDQYNPSGPGGYGPPSTDPLTGETISANAYLYGAALDRNAAWVRDIVKILNGELSLEDVIDGTYVQRWIDAQRTGTRNEASRRAYSKNELRAMVTAMERGRGVGISPEIPLDPMRGQQFQRLWREKLARLFDSGALGEGWDPGPERLGRLRGTAVEDALLANSEILGAAGFDPLDPGGVAAMTPEQRLMLSPLTRLQVIRYAESLQRKMEAKGVCFAVFDDRAYWAKALEYRDACEEGGMVGEECDEWIRTQALDEIYRSYALHEVGHNVGLRHNFEGSRDSMNYFPEYWDLRNDGTMGPRTADPWTEAELDGGIYEYQYSTVMDYTARYYGDIRGLGRYDHAALAYGWGGLVEAFDTEATGTTMNCGYLGLLATFAEFGAPSEWFWRPSLGALHYTQYPLVLGGGDFAQLDDNFVVQGTVDVGVFQRRKIGAWADRNMAAEIGIDPSATMRRGCYDYQPGSYDCIPGKPGLTWSELDNFDADPADDCNEQFPLCVREDPDDVCPADTCDPQKEDENCCTFNPGMGEDDLEVCDNGVELDSFGDPTVPSEPGEGAIARVPYRFCSDEFAGASISCARFDQGADVYETTDDIIRTYGNYYLFNNFGRDRYGFTAQQYGGYQSYIISRYFDPMHTVLQYYALYRTLFEGTGNQGDFATLDAFFSGPWAPFTAAAVETFRTFGNVITMPEPGTYVAGRFPDRSDAWTQCNDDPDGVCWYEEADNTEPDQPVIDLLDGRYIGSWWDFDSDECRYEWFNCTKRIGNMIDKTLAVEFLGEAGAGFVGRDTSVDIRQFTLNYYTMFKPQIVQIFGAILADDYASYVPRFVGLGDGSPVESATVGRVDWADVEPTPDGDLIDPATGFQVQLYATVMGMALFPTTYDQSFVNYSRVFVEGGGDDYINACRDDAGALDPAVCAWFDDPMSGKRYYARRFAPIVRREIDGKTGEEIEKEYPVDIGVRMIQRAADLWAAYDDTITSSNPDGDPGLERVYVRYVQNLDLMRNMADEFNSFFTSDVTDQE